MSVMVINLVRQPERKETTLRLLHECGLNHVTANPAVDGDALLAAGGRLRKQKTKWRLAFDRLADNVCVVDHLRMTALASAGGANPWRQYGCLRSHESMLHRVQEDL